MGLCQDLNREILSDQHYLKIQGYFISQQETPTFPNKLAKLQH